MAPPALPPGRSPVVLALAFAVSTQSSRARFEETLRRVIPTESRVLQMPTSAIVACVPFGRGQDERGYSEGLRAELSGRLRDRALSLGVGGPQPTGLLGRAVLHAEHALWLGRALYGDARTVLFEDLGEYRFISGQPRYEIRGFVASVLGPLAKPGVRNDALVITLETYLRSQGNQKAVARELKLHRNTVRQRLERIRALTGPRLSDSDGRLELRLAIIARRALLHLSDHGPGADAELVARTQ